MEKYFDARILFLTFAHIPAAFLKREKWLIDLDTLEMPSISFDTVPHFWVEIVARKRLERKRDFFKVQNRSFH